MTRKRKIKILPFRNHKVIKLSRYYYINQSNENVFIRFDGVKYYKIKKSDLRKMGMKLETKPLTYNTPEETEEMIRNLKTFLREKKNVFGPMMSEWGYKIKGINT